jgi:hypothetical protein
MEKFTPESSKEYRDELAEKIKDIRSADPENPENSRVKAQGYLDAKKESQEYQKADEIHQRDRFVDEEHKEVTDKEFKAVVTKINNRQAQIRKDFEGERYYREINILINPIREAFKLIKKREGELADYGLKIDVEYNVDYDKDPNTQSESVTRYYQCIGHLHEGYRHAVKKTEMGTVIFGLSDEEGQHYKIFEKDVPITEYGKGDTANELSEEDEKVIKDRIDKVVAKHSKDYKKV